MSRWVGALGVLAALGACGGEARVPIASVATVEVPAIPVAAGKTRPDAPHACDERDPTPDAMPATPAPTAFALLDAEIRRVQSEPGKYVYSGAVMDVLGDGIGTKGAFQLDAEEAMQFGRRLEKEVVETGDAPEWAVVARTREAEMFERLRDGLASTSVHLGSGPAPTGFVTLLTPKQLSLLMQSQWNTPAGAGNAAALSDAVHDFWDQRKQQEIDGANARIIDRYARAARLAPTKNPAAMRAVRRLAHYTSEIGDKKMARILGREYVPDMYRAECARLGAPP